MDRGEKTRGGTSSARAAGRPADAIDRAAERGGLALRDADLLDAFALRHLDPSAIPDEARALILDAYHRLALDPFSVEGTVVHRGEALRAAFGSDLRRLPPFVPSDYPSRRLQGIVATYAVEGDAAPPLPATRQSFARLVLGGRSLEECLASTGVDYFVAMGWAHGAIAADVDGTVELHRTIEVLVLDSILDSVRPRSHGTVRPALSAGEASLIDRRLPDLDDILGRPYADVIRSRYLDLPGRAKRFPPAGSTDFPSRKRAIIGMGLDETSPGPFKYQARYATHPHSDPVLDHMIEGQQRGYPKAVLDLRPSLFRYEVRRSMVECLRNGVTTAPVCNLSGMNQQSRIFWLYSILAEDIPNPDDIAPEDADLFLLGVRARCDDRRKPRFASTEEFRRIWQLLLETQASATGRGWNEVIMRSIERYAPSLSRAPTFADGGRRSDQGEAVTPPMPSLESSIGMPDIASRTAGPGDGAPAASVRDGELAIVLDGIAAQDGLVDGLDPSTVGELVGFLARKLDDVLPGDRDAGERYAGAWRRIRHAATGPRIGMAPSETMRMIDAWFSGRVRSETFPGPSGSGWFHLLAGEAVVTEVTIENGRSDDASKVFDSVVGIADRRRHLGPLVIRTDADGLGIALWQALVISNAGRHTTTTVTKGARIVVHPRPDPEEGSA